MKVRTEVLESDMARVEEGATAVVRVPALSDTLIAGTVQTVNPLVDPATGTGRVSVQVPNPDGELMAGLFAEVQVETRRLQDRLVVPEDAILLRQGRELVFVVEEGRAQWTYVDTGARSSGYAVIEDGVSPGDTVAVSGHFALAHDADVSVELAESPYGDLNGSGDVELVRRQEVNP